MSVAEILDFLSRGPASSSTIQKVTGKSQSAVARYLAELVGEVVAIRKGKSILYARVKNAFNSGNSFPIYTVDQQGNRKCIAYLRPLMPSGFFVEPASDVKLSAVLLGEAGNGLFPGLPYFLYDLRPQGFLGRHIAREMSFMLDDFPQDQRLWNDSHIGRYLLSNGSDLPGNLMLGEQAFLSIRQPVTPITDSMYPALAEKVINGQTHGSSAGGEQPKFTAYSDKSNAHVIVKFSPKGDNDVAKRWRDILLTEYYAQQTLADHNISAARTRLLDSDGRLFLESIRFDRTGDFGRIPMLSLSAIDAEFCESGITWISAARILHNSYLLSGQDLRTVETVWTFGRLINNTDMHLGNLSCTIVDDKFALLPIYDMCSMGYSPLSGGEVQAYKPFIPPTFQELNVPEDVYLLAKNMAAEFWSWLRADARISDELASVL